VAEQPKVVIDFPWEVADAPIEHDSYSFPTALGKAYITLAYFEDGTNICILATPTGAGRFMRISPDTDYALEERRSGEVPVSILNAVDEAWKHCVEVYAKVNRDARELFAAPSDTEGGQG